MSEDFKPGTRPLLRVAGLDPVRAFVSRLEETHVIWTAVLALLQRLWQEPDAAQRRETSGVTDSQVLAALRSALGENFGTEPADYISWCLVHYGCRQKSTLAALHPWEGLIFEWQQRRASAPRIALMLREGGLDKPLKADALEAIDGWITDPVAALGEASFIIEALFGERLVSFDLHDDGGTPAHDQLFKALVAAAAPTLTLVLPRQRLQRGDKGAAWRIEYTVDDAEYGFDAAAEGSALDVDAVLAGADALLERLGRPERLYRLAPGRAGNGETGAFVAVDSDRFPEIAWRLRLPLLRSPSVSQLKPGVPTAAPEPLRVGARPMAPRPQPLAAREAARVEAPAAGTTTTGDAMSMLESQFVPPPPPASAERPADPAMRQLLTGLRRSFGAGRLLQGGRWARQARAEAPSWMEAHGDPARIVYEKQEILFRKGRIGWAALVMADDGVFAAGEDDLAGLLVYSEDDYFDARPAELADVGARLKKIKAAGAAASVDLARFAEQVRNDSGRPLGVPVPAAVSARPVLLTSFVAIRAHLPEGLLGADWFPVLMHPSSVVPLIVPCMFWPSALLTAWQEHRLTVRVGR